MRLKIVETLITDAPELSAGAAARILMSDIAYAQNRAVATQTRHYVQFNGQFVTVLSRPAGSSTLGVIIHPITKDNYVTTYGDGGTSGLTATSIGTANFGTSATLGFDDLGSPFAYTTGSETPLTSPGTVTILSGNQTLIVSVEPYTGETTVR